MSKILIVDDSMVIRKMVKKSLEEDNFETEQAADGQEGFDVFQAHEFDLVITDINMPVLNGFGLIDKIRNSEHPNKDIPIVVLSTEFSDDIKAKGRAMGVNAWMVKPTEDSVLKEAVTVLIAQAKAKA